MASTEHSEAGQDQDLCQELTLKLIDTQRYLQKWHNALQAASGNPASNPLRGQGRALALLAKHNELRQREMGRMLGVRPQSLGEIVVKLERNGYVTRREVGGTDHSYIVSITDAGRSVIENAPELPQFEGFSAAEIKQFIDYLDRAAHDLDADCTALVGTDANAE
ncbi:MAG: MarR family transcriptional regulator [Coriobacteriaceae bacterium]|nr:MarR family transcriptional regulator [Coriobacteriaceae bacterium]